MKLLLILIAMTVIGIIGTVEYSHAIQLHDSNGNKMYSFDDDFNTNHEVICNDDDIIIKINGIDDNIPKQYNFSLRVDFLNDNLHRIY